MENSEHKNRRLAQVWLASSLVLISAGTVQANPLGGPDPTKLVASIVVVSAALLLEVFVTTGVLLFCGMAVVPMFFALVLGNIVSYLGVALPLYALVQRVWPVEIVIVAAEAVLIKLLSSFNLFQGDTFDGLKWRWALLAALAGNACSYYVGTLLVSA
jgi:hypothetical protein